MLSFGLDIVLENVLTLCCVCVSEGREVVGTPTQCRLSPSPSPSPPPVRLPFCVSGHVSLLPCECNTTDQASLPSPLVLLPVCFTPCYGCCASGDLEASFLPSPPMTVPLTSPDSASGLPAAPLLHTCQIHRLVCMVPSLALLQQGLEGSLEEGNHTLMV